VRMCPGEPWKWLGFVDIWPWPLTLGRWTLKVIRFCRHLTLTFDLGNYTVVFFDKNIAYNLETTYFDASHIYIYTYIIILIKAARDFDLLLWELKLVIW